MPPSEVLFVCTFNGVRSPMAAGLMRLFYGDAIRVDSCGLQPCEEVDPLAAVVMAEIGVDLSGHEPRRLRDMLGQRRFGSVVALSAEAWREVQSADGVAQSWNWPTPDPTGGDGSREARLEAYRLTRRDLEVRIIAAFGPPQHVLASHG